MRTATNPNARWLFPGRRAGQPLRPETVGKLDANNGIPSFTGRVVRLRQLVLQGPAPVVADALGIHYATAHRHIALMRHLQPLRPRRPQMRWGTDSAEASSSSARVGLLPSA
jgi:hypothetical protein